VKNINLWDIGVTTPVAFLITFLLGVLVGMGLYLEGIAGSVLVTGVLVSKKYSTSFSETLTHSEIINALEFGVIAFVLYPVVPNETIDPLGLINPRLLVFVVIVVASIGFAGFLALREIGAEKGLPVIGALGGLVNSEATSSAIATKARQNMELTTPAQIAVILTNSVMLMRNLVIAGIVSLGVMKLMLLPQLLMVAVGLIYAYTIKFEKRLKEMETPVESPFAIVPAIKFAVLFTVISILVHYIKEFGVGGVYLAALFGGLVSSAAVTASLASLAALGGLSLIPAANGCIIAAIGSTLGKLIIVRISGSKELLKKIATPVLITIFVGVVALGLQGM
jgi:uncharacterized membrane protein (DUF4010 family)